MQPSAAVSARKKRRTGDAGGALPLRTVRVSTPWRLPLQVYDGRDHIGALDDRTQRDPPERVVLSFAVDVAGRWRALGGFPTRIEASRAIPLRPRHAELAADGGSIRCFRSGAGR